MNQHIEMEVDDRGRLLLPSAVGQQLGLHLGMTLVVEQESAGILRIQRDEPRIVERQGVLVVEAEADRDVEWAAQHERERHLDEMLTRERCNLRHTQRHFRYDPVHPNELPRAPISL